LHGSIRILFTTERTEEKNKRDPVSPSWAKYRAQLGEVTTPNRACWAQTQLGVVPTRIQ
jgi:hypothetical protein